MLRNEAAMVVEQPQPAIDEDQKDDEIDVVTVAIISFGEVLEGIHITMPYTIAAYMVRDFLRGHDPAAKVDEEVVGCLTGLLASIFCAAQFVTSYGWGVFSDKYGRKPVLMMSIISGAVSALIFGMAGNYATAASARLLGGLLNATGGIVKTMLADTCSSRTLPRALGFLGLSWGLGTMVGPFIGGALANPCSNFGPHFPLCHKGGLFVHRPYLLPCLAASFLGTCAAIMSMFAVKETLPALRKDAAPKGDVEMAARVLTSDDGGKAGPEGMRRPSARSFLDYRDESGSDSNDDSLVSIEGGVRQMLTAVPPSPRPLIVPPSSAPATPRHHGPAGALYSSVPTAEAQPDPAHITGEQAEGKRAGAQQQQQQLRPQGIQSASEEITLLLGKDGVSVAPSRHGPWYHDRQVLLALGGYAIVSFLFNLLDEVRPIFASAPIEDGGLDMPTESLAWPLSFGGLSFILYVCLGYNRFYAAVGGVWCTRLGLIAVIPTALLIPVTTLFAHDRLAVQALLFLGMAVNAFADTNSYSGSNVLINAAGPADAAGAVNGAGQSVSSFMRAIGPFVGGFSWSFSIESGVQGHQYFVFVGAALVAFLSQFMYAYVDLPNLK